MITFNPDLTNAQIEEDERIMRMEMRHCTGCRQITLVDPEEDDLCDGCLQEGEDWAETEYSLRYDGRL
jgi:hypothetical protein